MLRAILGQQWKGGSPAKAEVYPKGIAYREQMPGELPEAANGIPRKVREAFARAGVAIEGHVVRFHMGGGR